MAPATRAALSGVTSGRSVPGVVVSGVSGEPGPVDEGAEAAPRVAFSAQPDDGAGGPALGLEVAGTGVPIRCPAPPGNRLCW